MKRQRVRGGSPLPLRYFDTGAYHPDATAGVDVLRSELIRPKIGGKTKYKSRVRQRQRQVTRKYKGGFIPSVMEPLVAGISKYIVPIALYSAYKLVSRHTSKGRKSSKK